MTESKPKIWCLFSVDNFYDQPEHNLSRWWAERPSIEALGKYLGYDISQANDDTVVKIVEIWKGNSSYISPGGTRYRLQCVEEGSP